MKNKLQNSISYLFSYKGCWDRKPYLTTKIITLLIMFALSKLHAQVPLNIAPTSYAVSFILILLGIINIMADIKRLRDLNQPSYLLIFLVALILFMPRAVLQILIIYTITLSVIKNQKAIEEDASGKKTGDSIIKRLLAKLSGKKAEPAKAAEEEDDDPLAKAERRNRPQDNDHEDEEAKETTVEAPKEGIIKRLLAKLFGKKEPSQQTQETEEKTNAPEDNKASEEKAEKPLEQVENKERTTEQTTVEEKAQEDDLHRNRNDKETSK